MRKRKKKGGNNFTRKPDRTLNEIKRTSASARKAEISMESVNEQPLQADKALKEGDDAPVDGVEVGHDDADAALRQDDDQGSNYDIDE